MLPGAPASSVARQNSQLRHVSHFSDLGGSSIGRLRRQCFRRSARARSTSWLFLSLRWLFVHWGPGNATSTRARPWSTCRRSRRLILSTLFYEALRSYCALPPVSGGSRHILPQCIRVSLDKMQLAKRRRARRNHVFRLSSLTGREHVRKRDCEAQQLIVSTGLVFLCSQ